MAITHRIGNGLTLLRLAAGLCVVGVMAIILDVLGVAGDWMPNIGVDAFATAFGLTVVHEVTRRVEATRLAPLRVRAARSVGRSLRWFVQSVMVDYHATHWERGFPGDTMAVLQLWLDSRPQAIRPRPLGEGETVPPLIKSGAQYARSLDERLSRDRVTLPPDIIAAADDLVAAVDEACVAHEWQMKGWLREGEAPGTSDPERQVVEAWHAFAERLLHFIGPEWTQVTYDMKEAVGGVRPPGERPSSADAEEG
jgi:hypothetical protein